MEKVKIRFLCPRCGELVIVEGYALERVAILINELLKQVHVGNNNTLSDMMNLKVMKND